MTLARLEEVAGSLNHVDSDVQATRKRKEDAVLLVSAAIAVGLLTTLARAQAKQ